MRRRDRARGEDFSLPLLDACTHGVLAVTTGEDTPYCLPLSFVRQERALYFHCAASGRKTDLLRRNPRVCVTFVGRDTPTYRDDDYTTLFSSVIVTGTAAEVTDPAEKAEALRALCQKLLPHAMTGDNFDRSLAASLPVTAVWRIDMDHISGKEKA